MKIRYVVYLLVLSTISLTGWIGSSPGYSDQPKNSEVTSTKSSPPLELVVVESFLPHFVYFTYKEKTLGAKYSDADAHIFLLEGMKQWYKEKWNIPKDWEFRVPWGAPNIVDMRPVMSDKSKFPVAFIAYCKQR